MSHHQKRRLMVMTKLPWPGHSKTRLIPALGAKGAAELAHRFLKHTLGVVFELKIESWEIWTSPSPQDPRWQPLWENWRGITGQYPVNFLDQGEGDLGARLIRGVQKGIREGYHVVVIGTDCPHLDEGVIVQAFEGLLSHDLVINPSLDGGYVLIGLKRYSPQIFTDIPWSTSAVTQKTLERVHELGWSVRIGKAFQDVDEKQDLPLLQDFGTKFLDGIYVTVEPKQEEPLPAVQPKQ